MLADTLNDIGTLLVDRLKRQLEKDGKVVSGKTLNSVYFVVSKNGLELRANASILTLTKRGRKPSQKKGEQKLIDIIKVWAKARGIPDKAAYAITQKIHKEGIKVPNKFTDGDLLVRAFEGVDTIIYNEMKRLMIKSFSIKKIT